MNRKASTLLACALLLTTAVRVDAHHSMDLSSATPIELQGEIVSVSWDGAHVMYRVQTKEADGRSEIWQILGASPKILRARGIRQSTFARGDSVAVVGRFDPHTQFIAPDYFVSASGRYEMGFYPH
jgi:hypothetical protein